MSVGRIAETARNLNPDITVGRKAVPSVAAIAGSDQFSIAARGDSRSAPSDALRDRVTATVADPRLSQLLHRQMVDAMLPKAGAFKGKSGCAEDMWRSMLVDILSQKSAAALAASNNVVGGGVGGSSSVESEARP